MTLYVNHLLIKPRRKRNLAGGLAHQVDRWELLDRFLILGSEDGTYYVGERELTLDHAQNLQRLLAEDGARVVKRIVDISASGRAVKNDSALFALALAASTKDDETRALALAALPTVARTGTHLFQFAESVRSLRGWGRGLRRAIGAWYNARPSGELELQLTKYAQRHGWTHADLLRLSHPAPLTAEHGELFRFAVDGVAPAESRLIEPMNRLKSTTDITLAAKIIREARLPRELVPTELLRHREVWEALLPDMPFTATIRNLGTLSKVGALESGSYGEEIVLSRLANRTALRLAKVHPVAVLAALTTYSLGRSLRGSGQWVPNRRVIDALDAAFYAAFESVEPTGKRLLLGLDVSGSMAGTRVAGHLGIGCREAAATMALVTLATETGAQAVAFDTKAYALSLSNRQRLDDVVNLLEKTGGGGTDTAQPILFALKRRIPVDGFVIYTDSETWAGDTPTQVALNRYRDAMGIDAKIAVVAMAATRTTIADPGDALAMNIVGFDASAPEALANFLLRS